MRRAAAALAMASLLAVAGCASTGAGTAAANAKPEDQVTARANQRWQHLLAGRFDQAYTMLTPAYRALHSEAEYRSTFQGAVKWKAANVVNATCEPEKCEVRVELKVLSPLARRADDTLSTYFTETWLWSDGGWYHYEKP